MSVRVHLEQFEGPLPLLLYLIRKNEMDIYNIEIYQITSQYLEYLKVMKELDLEVAAEFISMAALLIHIKSKMLLPQYNEEGDAAEGSEDPRKELVQKLLEYQQFQEITKWFKDRPLLGKDTWRRGFREIWSDGDSAIILDEGGLFAMIALYRKALKKVKKGVHVVMEKTQSLASRIMELKDHLIPGRTIEFRELISVEEFSKTKLVITFMSILELGRLGFISVFQSELLGPIQITTKKAIERDVVSRVQELEATPEVQAAIPSTQSTMVKVTSDAEPELMASDEEIDQEFERLDLESEPVEDHALALQENVNFQENPESKTELTSEEIEPPTLPDKEFSV